VLWVPAGIAMALLVLPLAALVARVPWGDVGALLLAPSSLQALGLSLWTGLTTTAISLVLGVPLAAVLAGADGWPTPLRRTVRAAVTVPLVLPPVVGGIALLLLLGRQGLLGGPLASLGLTIPFSATAVVIAQTFVSMPFLVLSVEGALRGADGRFAVVAASLGASRWYAFRRVTLPLVAPGVISGAVLCFARALGEFGATITFAGSLPGVTRTLPVAAYLGLQSDPEAAVVLALMLLVVAVVVLVSLRERWLRTVP
jgi:molybdate transport system permease protein